MRTDILYDAGMISFDASELGHWADKPDAHHQLPELMRRLILATCPMPSLIAMPSGSSVTRPGWDGLLDVEKGNAWVPTGVSAWELSVETRVERKADEDYAKRTAAPGEVEPSQAAFVFVTPRKWDRKTKWACGKRKEGRWRDVRALDADDLVAWLEAAPSAAVWFAALIGKMPDSGWTSLDAWWTNWASMANPAITPELALAGRGDEADALANWARGEPAPYYLQGTARDEAIAFLAACAHANAGSWGAALMARSVVVETLDAWRSLENHSFPLTLIRAFAGEANVKVAAEKGHYVFVPLGAREDTKGAGCKLPPLLGRDETPHALMEMGLSEAQARAHTRKSARRLLVLRRRLIDEAEVSPPEWVEQASSIASLALIGEWDGGKEADRKFVAEVAGQPYEEAERAVQALSNLPDAPLERTGARWAFVSREEAWHLLAPNITGSEIERFVEVAVPLLRTASPKFDLPVEERYMANIVGKAMPHSDEMRSGVAQGLAMMGVYPDRVKSVDAIEGRANYAVYRVLGKATWQTWATLSGDLQTLAEAAPDAFLDAVDAGLTLSPSPFTDLFAQESDGGGIVGEAAHPGLLWALEMLAWSEEHFSRSAKALARLAELDPGGQLSNRPSESLRNRFIPEMRFTEASGEDRVQALSMLLRDVPNAGWELLMNIHRPLTFVLPQPPSWRPWAQDGAPPVTDAGFASFVEAMDRLVLENVGTNAERWAGLVDAIGRFPPEVRRQAIGMLAERIDAVKQHPSSYILWEKIRRLLNRHRSHPDVEWAMGPGDLDPLDNAYHALTPSDPVKAYAWLFNQGAGLPNPAPIRVDHAMEGCRVNQRLLEEEQRRAMRQAYEQSGDSAVLGIVELADHPAAVGLAVASSLDDEVALDLALPCLGAPAERTRLFARGVSCGLYGQRGWEPLERALVLVKQRGSQPDALADVYLAAPSDPSTWERLEQEAQEVHEVYWKALSEHAITVMNGDHLTAAIVRLIEAGRAADVVWPAAMREDVPASCIVKILEHAPQGDSYCIARLLGKLDASADVTDETITRLEIPYADALGHDRPNLKIHQEVIKSPTFFADLIAWRFKRSDGQTEEEIDSQTRQHRAAIACKILWDLHGVPGMTADGNLNAGALEAWVSEARRLCKANGREVIGDQRIGQVLANAPAGADGVWPCEPVRDLLDAIASPHLGLGFVVGKRNLRGVTTRGVFDGGAQETSLAESYRKDAQLIAARWPFTAKLLRDIADSYKSDSLREDNEAAWLDRFGA